MFDSLADRIREDENKESSPKDRLLRYIAIATISVLVIGGIYYGVRLVQ